MLFHKTSPKVDDSCLSDLRPNRLLGQCYYHRVAFFFSLHPGRVGIVGQSDGPAEHRVTLRLHRSGRVIFLFLGFLPARDRQSPALASYPGCPARSSPYRSAGCNRPWSPSIEILIIDHVAVKNFRPAGSRRGQRRCGRPRSFHLAILRSGRKGSLHWSHPEAGGDFCGLAWGWLSSCSMRLFKVSIAAAAPRPRRLSSAKARGAGRAVRTMAAAVMT